MHAMQISDKGADTTHDDRRRLKELSDTRAAGWPNTLSVSATPASLCATAPFNAAALSNAAWVQSVAAGGEGKEGACAAGAHGSRGGGARRGETT